MILKALSIAVPGESLSGYLPLPLANEVIDYIRDLSVVRRLVPSFNQSTRIWTKPKKANAGAAYFIQDGVTATLTGFSTTQVQWVAKKLMAFSMIDEEAIEDSQPDVVQQVLNDFSEAVAQAEEMAVLDGDPTHLATAPTPDSATGSSPHV
jgi:HK97 family phage major capsid protein